MLLLNVKHSSDVGTGLDDIATVGCVTSCHIIKISSKIIIKIIINVIMIFLRFLRVIFMS